MSDALFTDLSVEQQEVVAGGFVSGLTQDTSYFNKMLAIAKQSNINSAVSSGPAGSLSAISAQKSLTILKNVTDTTGSLNFYL